MKRRLIAYKKNLVPPGILHNLFVGGTTSFHSSQAAFELAFRNLSPSFDNFEINGSDIKANSEDTVYQVQNNAFRDITIGGNQILTYFIETSGFINVLRSSSFRNIDYNGFKFVAEGVTLINNEAFVNSEGVEYLRFPNLASIGIKGLGQLYDIKRCYIPNNTTFGTDALQNMNSNAIVYINNAASTNASITSISSTKIIVTDFTSPNQVTNLSASNIGANSVQLDFTPPSSVNSLDFYEVWIDDGTDNPVQLHHFFDEISSSGSTLNGLQSGTEYKIKIVACDVFWNRSAFSNEITINTI